MKKIFIFIIAMMLIPTKVVSATEEVKFDNYARSDVQVIKDYNVLYYSPSENITTYFQHISVNNVYSYCLKYSDIIENTSDHSLENPQNMFSDEQWRLFSLYAMYGERLFSQTNDVNYRYAAQALIHEQTSPVQTPMIFYNYSQGIKTAFSVDSYKQEIINLYNIHITLPNIDIESTEFKVGDEYKFADTSNVISKYYLETDSEFADFSIEDNYLKINVKKQGVQNFALVSSPESKEGDVLLWTSSKFQDLVSVSAFNPSRIDYSFETRNKIGSLVINKKDSATKELLSGAVFNLKKESEGAFVDVGNYTVDKELRIDNLEVGNYILEEISAPAGYKISDQKYEFSISEDGEVVILEIENLKTLPSTGLRSNVNRLFILTVTIFFVYIKKSLLK